MVMCNLHVYSFIFNFGVKASFIYCIYMSVQYKVYYIYSICVMLFFLVPVLLFKGRHHIYIFPQLINHSTMRLFLQSYF